MEGREEGGEGEREGGQETSCVVLPGEEAEVRSNNQSIHVHVHVHVHVSLGVCTRAALHRKC